MLLTRGQGVSIIPSLSLNCVINMWEHSAIVEITLDFGSGSLNSRTFPNPSIWVPEVVMGKRKAAALWYQLLEVSFSNSFSFLIFHIFLWLLHVWPLIYMLMSSKP